MLIQRNVCFSQNCYLKENICSKDTSREASFFCKVVNHCVFSFIKFHGIVLS